MSEAVIHDPVLIALNEAREKSQEKINPKQIEQSNRRIQRRTKSLINAWKCWYETNPDRRRFKKRKQKVDRLIEEISQLKKEQGSYKPDWMVKAHEIFLRLYEDKQI